jgi:hypothetical protein
MSDLDLINDLHRRCLHLLGEKTSYTIEDVQIEHRDSLTVSIISKPTTDSEGDTWRTTATVYDTQSPVQDQLISKIRDYVIPILQRRMILEDLSDV